MIVQEVFAKSILSKSKVFDYSLNPYIGCIHGCKYCYARFMKRFSRHKEAWGTFVDVKLNAVRLLSKELNTKRVGKVWISGVCDPYQPLETKYELTRQCIQLLGAHNWPIVVQTKAHLIARDIEVLRKCNDIEVGITITTCDDNIRKIYEPRASTINDRINILKLLHSQGIPTFAMIAPILPHTEGLVPLLVDKVDYILVDRMNYRNLNVKYFGYHIPDVCPICHKKVGTRQVHLHYPYECINH